MKYNYGGEAAHKNPLFMKTNYILAAAWGVYMNGFRITRIAWRKSINFLHGKRFLTKLVEIITAKTNKIGIHISIGMLNKFSVNTRIPIIILPSFKELFIIYPS